VLYGFVAMALSGWVAVLAGWYTTEIGRQPWLVHGVLTTAQAVAEVPAPMVLSTLIAYLAVYAVLTGAYVAVLIYLAWSATHGKSLPTRGGVGDPVERAVETGARPGATTPAE
jgi:cytochrome d ubiquinol oxidase subunit I